ncbi:phage tail protein [Nocardia sp. CA-120079]|uniref:phage tail protein n=1 Tax=Nocardia sp. CA-120079 TaxID=3239974 RepID=UPI003D9641D9
MAIGDTISGSTFIVDLGKFQVETVEQISGLSLAEDAVEIKQVTPDGEVIVGTQPGSARSGEITIIRGLDQSRVFTEWIYTTMTMRDVDDARQDITLMVLDPNKKPVKRVHLARARASDWRGPSLDAGANSPATEAVTIVYEDITVENT